MADPICRWRNSSIKQVLEFNSLFPNRPTERVSARRSVELRWAMLGGKDFFTTPYQLAAQMAIYYEDDTNIYPQFDKLISLEEANEYITRWAKKYYAPNPYAKSMQQGQKAVVINNFLVNWVIEHGDQCSFREALSEMFVDSIGNTDILVNLINNFMEVEIVNGEISLKDSPLREKYPDDEVWPNVDINDKKTFFEYVGGKKYSSHFDGSHFIPQQIFYGAPGTGKSNTIKREVDDKGLPNVRTTFHPDSDYSTFVGAYKPTSTEVPMMTMIGTKAVPVENPDGTPRKEKKIVYEFVPQAFLKAYTGAWKNQDEPFFLIIEEINRGNCAQIFGDLFQLLDRNDEGESDYPISPDEDIQKFLLTDKKYGFAELTEEQKEAIPEEIKLGQLLKLPKNLHIWATMNTSDQSLFPIDSAFKRRWDWQYMPISDGKKDWKIEVNGKRYDWWLFLVKINEKISDTTNSEDKKLGYYFCKAKNGKIDVETFVGKVIFYLWNDVFKDFAEEAGDLFQDEDGLLTFNKFYMVDTDGKTRVVEDKVELFLKNLGVEEDEVIEYMQDDEAEAMPTDRATDASNRLHVVFSDGETIRIQTGKEYVDVLKKIGLDKAYEIAKSKNPGILKCAFVTKEKEDAIENSSYLRYETIGEYHVVRGMSGDTMRPFLEKISNRYNLGLKFYRQ